MSKEFKIIKDNTMVTRDSLLHVPCGSKGRIFSDEPYTMAPAIFFPDTWELTVESESDNLVQVTLAKKVNK